MKIVRFEQLLGVDASSCPPESQGEMKGMGLQHLRCGDPIHRDTMGMEKMTLRSVSLMNRMDGIVSTINETLRKLMSAHNQLRVVASLFEEVWCVTGRCSYTLTCNCFSQAKTELVNPCGHVSEAWRCVER